MDLTVSQLKVGARLRLGSYHCNPGNTYIPIYWVKTGRDNLFITESIIDYLAFDGKEPQNARSVDVRYFGNPDYELSNIKQFLNSEEIEWFEKTHDADEPPASGRTDSWDTNYQNHPGFLNGFEAFEVASLDGDVRLPHLSEIIGDSHLPLFSQKGVRPKMTAELYRSKLSRYAGYRASSFCDFCTQDIDPRYESQIVVIGRDGRPTRRYPFSGVGVRPLCKIKPDTKVAVDDNGVYIIKPFETEEEGEFCTMDEIYHYLGLR